MTRIAALSLDQAPAGSRAALEGIQKGLGFIPNVFKTLAHSPAALSGYQSLAQALGKTSLSAVEREVVHARAVVRQEHERTLLFFPPERTHDQRSLHCFDSRVQTNARRPA